MEEEIPKKKPWHSIGSLRLDVESAMAGKTWLLLPEGFRDQESGHSYPLPSHRTDLQKLVAIPIPPRKTDSGCIYLKRAMVKWRQAAQKANSAYIKTARIERAAENAQYEFRQRLKELRADVRGAVEQVKQEADKAIAGLNDLFALGRRGLDGQMRAHLDGTKWQGEEIDARAFRECFRMVTQAVKGLGLPSEQRDRATEAILEEVAASFKDTQETVSLASDPEKDGVEH